MGGRTRSSFPIEDSGFPETDEEMKQAYELYLSEINAGHLKETPVSYKEFTDNCRSMVHLHHKRLWNTVKSKLENYVGPRYRFVVSRNPYGERRKCGLFINVPNTIIQLKRHYQEFAKLYGKPFDPETILDEISNEESDFWNKVFRSNYLLGILFGYGYQNSYEFDWRMRNSFSTPRLKVEGQELMPLIKEKITIEDLRLPNISVYSVTDRKLKKYRKERKAIIKELKGKDFEKTIKAWLTEGAQKGNTSVPLEMPTDKSAFLEK